MNQTKMKIKHIIFGLMFLCGCACLFFLNNDRPETPTEILHEKTSAPPEVEMPEGVDIYSDPRLETIYVAYTSDTGKTVVETRHSCKGCHWRCVQGQ